MKLPRWTTFYRGRKHIRAKRFLSPSKLKFGRHEFNSWEISRIWHFKQIEIIPADFKPEDILIVTLSLRSLSLLLKLPQSGSNVGAARKVFPLWSQKTITHHCLSLFPIVSRLGYRTNWLLGLGELLHPNRDLTQWRRELQALASRFSTHFVSVPWTARWYRKFFNSIYRSSNSRTRSPEFCTNLICQS